MAHGNSSLYLCPKREEEAQAMYRLPFVVCKWLLQSLAQVIQSAFHTILQLSIKIKEASTNLYQFLSKFLVYLIV